MQNVEWGGSHYTLCIIFNEAVRKINGYVREVQIESIPKGGFRAHVGMTTPPYVIYGEPAPTELAARAKAYYAVIKHVNTMLGYLIFDLNHTLTLHQSLQIQRFDHKMNNIHRCGEKLRAMMYKCHEVYVSSFEDLLCKLDAYDETVEIIKQVRADSLFNQLV